MIRMKYKDITHDTPTYFIADIAANHDGELNRAKDLIYKAKEAGADCAKFQHFKAETIVSDKGFKALTNVQTHQSSWKESVDVIYDRYHTRSDWDEELISTCEDAQIEFMTTPYDLDAVKRYSKYTRGLKIGSGDITFEQLIRRVCETGQPVFLATGAASDNEVSRAVGIVQEYGNDLCLFQCNTNYTGDLENFSYVNLNVLKEFRNSYPNAILGLSDHTPGHAAVLGAVTLGARVIEKHFTDDNSREGPDHKFALNPTAWSEMVNRTRELELALGDGIKRIEKNEESTVIVQRRAIRAKIPLSKGAILKEDDVIFLRPCTSEGFTPFDLSKIAGRRIKQNVDKGEELRECHFLI